MSKKNIIVVQLLLFLLTVSLAVDGQNTINDTINNNHKQSNDSIYTVSDSLVIADTVLASTDTIFEAAQTKKVKDTTYYSLYGYLMHVQDTLPIEKWKYNTKINQVKMHIYDSILDLIHIDHPAYKEIINNNYLGHTGLAVKSNHYFETHNKSKFIFLQPFTPYTFQANQSKYYNVQSPFTKFAVSIGSREEQNIDVLHTQNVNPFFNVTANFKSFTGKGQYLRQETRNNATIFGAVYSRGPLTTHANFVFNKVNVQESGGIHDYRMITDTSINISENLLGNKIEGGATLIKNRQFFFDQKIGFIKARYNDTSQIGGYWFSLQYNYQWDKSMKQYNHTNDEYTNSFTGETLNYYSNNYSSSTETFDSCSFINKDNLFRLNLEEIPGKYPGFGAYFGLGFNSGDYYYFNKDTLFNNSQSKNINSNFLEAGIYRLQSRYVKFTGKYRWYTGGYREGDFELSGSLFQDFGKDSSAFVLKFEGGMYKETPDYFMKNYYSNHFKWNSDLDASLTTKFMFSADFPKFRTTANARYAILSKYIYFNDEVVPTQHSNAFTILNANVKNTFPFWKFRLLTQIDYQLSSNNDVLPLPEFSYYGALYIDHLAYFKSTGGKMRIQLGADLRYWSSFYAQQYVPSLSTFSNQKTQLIGNYPFVGAFLDFEIKRLRFYFRAEHVNFEYSDKNYFASPGYPTGRFGIRYGLIWTFYD